MHVPREGTVAADRRENGSRGQSIDQSLKLTGRKCNTAKCVCWCEWTRPYQVLQVSLDRIIHIGNHSREPVTKQPAINAELQVIAFICRSPETFNTFHLPERSPIDRDFRHLDLSWLCSTHRVLAQRSFTVN